MALTRVDGVEQAAVSYEVGKATVAYDPTRTNPDAFIAELATMTGYGAEIIDDPGIPLVVNDDIGLEQEALEHDHDAPGHDHEHMSLADSTSRN